VDVSDPVCPACNARLVQLNRREKDELVGTVIDGRFEVRGFLGQGGMGTVYRAWQKSIGREVAIKVIDRRFVSDEMAVRRFLREARLASQLSQPNTVSIFDVGQSADGRLFLAMELLRGRTLQEVVAADGPFSAQRAAHVGVQLCDALDAASRLQIVHRDLKPANVILLDDPPGRDLIKVLDFGLAKTLGVEESSATQSGLLVGTPTYMAPEVLMGANHTVSSDLYAVGVILGEIAIGEPLWPMTSYSLLLSNKFEGSKLTAELSSLLRPIVERLISADAAKRYASPIELRAALKPVMESRESGMPRVSFRPAGPPRGHSSSSEATVQVVTPARLERATSPSISAIAPTPAPAPPPPRPRRRAMVIGIGAAAIAILAVVLVLVLALRKPARRAVVALDDAGSDDAGLDDAGSEDEDADVEPDDDPDDADVTTPEPDDASGAPTPDPDDGSVPIAGDAAPR